MRMLIILACILTLQACSGPSKEELRRMQLLEAQRAEQAALAAQKEAQEREIRTRERLSDARTAWSKKTQLSQQQINTLFSNSPEDDLSSDKIYYVQFDLQPAKYNYGQNKQSFTIVGMRNLPNSAVYGPLFPDEKAQYQPGQLAKSVLEFALKEETEINRIGQEVLRDRGQRWVAAVLNFKNYDSLVNQNNRQSALWRWEPGLFDDLSWDVTPEVAYPYTSERTLSLQLGLRFCLLKDRCYLDSDYRKHPTHAVRAEVISVLVASHKKGEILAEFIREKE
ncbi:MULTISPECIES: hypothetical protein [Thalassolituus]|uniref:hypothetical protein n=1 Tax=Thalassolituus TaxID=187492 RepID=UPI001CE24897|nr:MULTISPECIES: hypothetical protein [Thalassolituus]MCA6058243.1 hypothetical protein [Thalassolituus sp. ST750PaO-4]MCB2386641.1 hypothetical protein [Thalassolituus alkanivorans]MCB2424181.1 hypothetical protein [Thalassolituus alkanivorans]